MWMPVAQFLLAWILIQNENLTSSGGTRTYWEATAGEGGSRWIAAKWWPNWNARSRNSSISGRIEWWFSGGKKIMVIFKRAVDLKICRFFGRLTRIVDHCLHFHRSKSMNHCRYRFILIITLRVGIFLPGQKQKAFHRQMVLWTRWTEKWSFVLILQFHLSKFIQIHSFVLDDISSQF